MARVHRWACQEKRRTLEDLTRLAAKLRADRERVGPVDDGQFSPPDAAIDLRRAKLNRTIADIDAAIDRAREELDAAERELAQVEQMSIGRPAEESGSVRKRQRRNAAMPRTPRR
jgi:hypothetical protein